MAQFTVRAIPDFAELNNALTKLSSKPVKIAIDASGLENVSAEYSKVLNAQAKLLNAQTKADALRQKEVLVAEKVTQAQEKTRAAVEKTNQAREKTKQAQENTLQQTEKTAQAQEKTKQAAERTKQEVAKTERAQAGLNGKLKEGGERAGILGDKLGNVVAKVAAWQVLNGAISTTIGAFRKAIDTLKAVDDQLVVIRKVGAADEAALQAIEEQAYKTASAYGVAADKYLESVAAFARAGYKEHSADLAELAVKTQLVGDTDAETANQFLLSVDAAYKYKGSIEALTKVLDGANEIDNKYATSIQKIAEGMGIVAPVAAQMNVEVDELAAGIGTITAVTQRSGTEAARALRALMLNIVGDTKTEIDEGVTWTTGEIAGLRDVINTYAADAVKAAEATGEVIDPMLAIGGLAQSMKDGVLTAAQLTEMVSDIGGKLRTSQLLAIVQNWDMYESMLADFQNAAGSADKEVENALDSWTRKTEILKNTWTEFISHLVETAGIKGALDLVTKAVELLDSDVGHAVITVAALTAGFVLLNKVTKSQFAQSAVAAVQNLMNISAAAEGTRAKIAAVTETLASSPLGIFMLLAGLNAALNAAVDAGNYTAEEARRAAEESRAAWDEAKRAVEDANGELETTAQRIQDLQGLEMPTLADQHELSKLQAENAELERRLELLRETEKIKQEQYQQDIKDQFDAQFYNTAWQNADTWYGAAWEFVRSLWTQMELTPQSPAAMQDALGWDAAFLHAENIYKFSPNDPYWEESKQWLADQVTLLEGFRKSLEESGDTSSDFYQGIVRMMNTIGEILGTAPSVESAIADMWSEVNDTGGFDAMKAGAEGAKEGLESLRESAGDTKTALENLYGKLSGVKEVFADFEQRGRLSYSALKSIQEGFADVSGIDEYVERLSQAGLTTEELQSIMGELVMQEAAAIIEQEGLTESSQSMIAALLREIGVVNSDEVAMYLLSSAAFNAKGGIDAARQAVNDFNNASIDSASKEQAFANIVRAANRAMSAIWNAVNATGSYSPPEPVEPFFGSTGGSAGGGGSGARGSRASSQKDEEWERLKDIVSLLESELDVLDAQGKPLENRIDKMREIQDALHNEAEYLRQIGGHQEDINKLSVKWWDIQKDIAALQKDLISELDTAVKEKLEEADKARDAEVKAIEAQIDALKDKAEQEEKALKLEELQAAVLEKQNDLLDAQKDRTVRIYNAKTGMWEWVADQKKVGGAQEALDDARKDLEDYEKELAKDAAIADLEARKQEINENYDALKDEWDTIIKSMQEPGREIGDILSDIAKNGTPRMQAQVERINELLGKLGDYIDDVTGKEKDEDEDYANDSTDYSALMEKAGSEAEFWALAEKRDKKAAALGVDYKGSGFRTNDEIYAQWLAGRKGSGNSGGGNSGAGYSPSVDYSAQMETAGSEAEFWAMAEARDKKAAALGVDIAASGYRTNAQLYEEWKAKGRTYDQGGVLYGLGGIKATNRNEIVLPPDITERMLSPNAGQVFRERLAEARFLYGAADRGANSLAGNVSRTSISDHSGDEYHFGGITIGEQAARTTTVYDLAQSAKALRIYKA